METKREVEIRHGWAQKDILNILILPRSVGLYQIFWKTCLYVFYYIIWNLNRKLKTCYLCRWLRKPPNGQHWLSCVTLWTSPSFQLTIKFYEIGFSCCTARSGRLKIHPPSDLLLKEKQYGTSIWKKKENQANCLQLQLFSLLGRMCAAVGYCTLCFPFFICLASHF